MFVRDCMTAEVKVITPETSLREAAILMRDGDFGSVPVGENDRLVGVVTDRDLAVRAVAEGFDANTTPVRHVMSEGILYCYEDQMIDEVIQNMGDVQVRRLPVLNREKRMVGILSLGDAACAKSVDERLTAESLSQISKHQHKEIGARGHAFEVSQTH
ncbi:MAG: CBS domain-containing protein [Bdellovibrionia bacterium]